MIPVRIGYIWGVYYFDKLEREKNDYHPVNHAAAERAFKKFQEEVAALHLKKSSSKVSS